MTSPKKPVESATPQEIPTQTDLEERIRRRAYEIYQARGSADGHDLDHWLEAESEIRTQQTRSVAA